MSYSIAYSPKAQRDLQWWKKNGSKQTKAKISCLLKELEEHPETGTGKPKRLCGELSGYWSRRINDKDRIVYSIKGSQVIVYVLSMMGHYGDK